MYRNNHLMVTAVVEVGTAILLLLVPAIPISLLLGVEQAAPEASVVARMTGAALLAIGVACWMGRRGQRSPIQTGLMTGIFIYNVMVSALLIYSGTALKMAGTALWPGVVLHILLAGWGIASFIAGARQ